MVGMSGVTESCGQQKEGVKDNVREADRRTTEQLREWGIYSASEPKNQQKRVNERSRETSVSIR